MNQRIKEVRLHLGLNQSEFGERLAITGAAISRSEAGNREASNQVVLAICREFDVNERWLRTGEGEMFLTKPREQELADFFASVLSVDPPDTRACLIHALSKLSVSQWEALTDVINTMVADWETQKSRPHE